MRDEDVRAVAEVGGGTLFVGAVTGGAEVVHGALGTFVVKFEVDIIGTAVAADGDTFVALEEELGDGFWCIFPEDAAGRGGW